VTKVSAFLSGISLSTSRLNSLMKRHWKMDKKISKILRLHLK
jgi:hypothetical protein